MEHWQNLFTLLPMPQSWMQALLFTTFALHLLFVLLMVGTVSIGFVQFLKGFSPANENKGQETMTLYLGFKGLAVVLGVGPLLILQVLYYKPFFTATGFLGYAWLAVIPLLIIAFLSIEIFERRMQTWRFLGFIFGLIGLVALLTVPAVFTCALALMERPSYWQAFASGSISMSDPFLWHWVLRYLHIVGASLVLGSAFHLAVIFRKQPDKTPELETWLFNTIIFQILSGLLLLLTVIKVRTPAMAAGLSIGAAAAVLVAFKLFRRFKKEPLSRFQNTATITATVIIFVAMIFARQSLQDSALLPMRTLSQNTLISQAHALDAYHAKALAQYETKLDTVYDNGQTIYDNSCLPCHGDWGHGDGFAGRRLLVKAEDLAAISGKKDYIRQVLLNGWAGSAMPYFKVFDKAKIDSLEAELDRRFGMFSQPEMADVNVSEAAGQKWEMVCSTCHGARGIPTEFGRGLKPMPPDFTQFHLTHERAMEIITNGYPGTVMQPYRELPSHLRKGLIALLDRMYMSAAQ